MLFLCCSCAEIQNLTILNDNGTIDEMVYVSVDKQTLESKGCNYQHTKDLIAEKSMLSAQKICNEFEWQLDLEIDFAEDVETKMFLTSLKGGVNPVVKDWQDEIYVIGLRFKNSNVYRHFYGITSGERKIDEVEKHFLYTKVIYYGLSSYADSRFTNLYNSLAEEFNTEFAGKFVDLQDTKLYFTYTTTEHREHSDADVIFKAGDKYYHTWEIVKNTEAQHGEDFYQVLNI